MDLFIFDAFYLPKYHSLVVSFIVMCVQSAVCTLYTCDFPILLPNFLIQISKRFCILCSIFALNKLSSKLWCHLPLFKWHHLRWSLFKYDDHINYNYYERISYGHWIVCYMLGKKLVRRSCPFATAQSAFQRPSGPSFRFYMQY